MTFTLNTPRSSALTSGLTLRQAVPALSRLVKAPGFMGEHVWPFAEGAQGDGGWYVSYRQDDQSCSLQVFVWPPGTATRIHDHTSWGAFRCMVGTVLEERYERLDDGSLEDHARLKKLWVMRWGREDGTSTVLPYELGIHRISNPSGETAISVHLYGPKLGDIDGRDYEPSRDYVCDRQDDLEAEDSGLLT